MADFLRRSRMSLSHLARLEQALAQFHRRFTGKRYALRVRAVPGRFPVDFRRRLGIAKSLQLSAGTDV
jgi:hypothetical protein